MSSTRVEDKLIEYEYRCTEYRFAEYEYEENNCLTRSQRRGSCRIDRTIVKTSVRWLRCIAWKASNGSLERFYGCQDKSAKIRCPR